MRFYSFLLFLLIATCSTITANTIPDADWWAFTDGSYSNGPEVVIDGESATFSCSVYLKPPTAPYVLFGIEFWYLNAESTLKQIELRVINNGSLHAFWYLPETNGSTSNITIGAQRDASTNKYLSLSLTSTHYTLDVYDVVNSQLTNKESITHSLIAPTDLEGYGAVASWSKYRIETFSSAPTEHAWLSTLPVTTHPNISTLPKSIPWTDDGDGTFSATNNRFYCYEYKPAEAYGNTTTTSPSKITTVAGPLKRSWINRAWSYDTTAGHPATATTPGHWSWIGVHDGSEYSYSYNATTKIWQPYGWDSLAGRAGLKESVPWTYDPVLLEWNQSSQGKSWTYDAETKKWTSILTTFTGGSHSSTWAYDYATNQWTDERTGEVWELRDEYIWHLVSDNDSYYTISPANGAAIKYVDDPVWYSPWRLGRLYGSPDNNLYLNDNGTEHYNWYTESGTYSFGRYDPWNTELPEWRSSSSLAWTPSSGSGTKYFPREFPPLVVLQHQDIISAYDAAESAEILSSAPTPTATWEANGRSNEFGVAITYDTAESTAPLKVTASSPDTQLLSNLAYNPIFTSLGDWEYKDTTNGHTWTFDDATGTWQNSTTGYQWSYSNPTALRWHHAASDTYWEYDENTESWTQLIDDGD